MNSYEYNSKYFDDLQAKFYFTDVDGNRVEGTYYNWNLYDLLSGLADGYMTDEKLHNTENPPIGVFNGIVDITKPINIVITKPNR